ncbi:type II toxin-antitoxin system HipA family toxin [Woeseia oceani]|nr:type II toxin-antitoxin system HipA family toxin [Woeseia oceani]
MARQSKSRRLGVWMNGELVGHWTIDATGQHEFRYAETWIAADETRPLSLSMPLQPADTPYRGDLVESFFDNLLPDSIDIRRRVQARFGAASVSAFDLLFEVGRECVGAVQLLPPDNQPESIRQIDAEPLDEEGVAGELRAAISAAPLGQRDHDPFRISLAGAQEKSALLLHQGQWHRPTGATPTTHIFKLPLGRVGNMQADLSTSVENEWLCRQIVHAFGIPAANCQIADFADQHVLIVERFDRRLARDKTWWIRLPQEDMCQATGSPAAARYEADGGPGIAAISSLLMGSQDAITERRVFFQTQVLFWMLCATDGHAKNFSVFIGPRGRFSLTPSYDVISAYPILGSGRNQLAPQKAKLAMAVLGKNRHYRWAEIQPRHWLSTAREIGLKVTAEEDMLHLGDHAPRVVEEVSAMLPGDFPKAVSEPIFDGLLRSAKKLAHIAG